MNPEQLQPKVRASDFVSIKYHKTCFVASQWTTMGLAMNCVRMEIANTMSMHVAMVTYMSDPIRQVYGFPFITLCSSTEIVMIFWNNLVSLLWLDAQGLVSTA
jgi:hypothetical protein